MTVETLATLDFPPSTDPADGWPEPEPLPATKARVGPQTGGKTRGRKMLVSLAGTMNKRGMSLEAIEAALLVENTAKCNPPLPEAKVRKIAVDIVKRYSAGEPTAPVAAALPPMTAEDAARITGNCSKRAEHGFDVTSLSRTSKLSLWPHGRCILTSSMLLKSRLICSFRRRKKGAGNRLYFGF